jgi:hypothetical protein
VRALRGPAIVGAVAGLVVTIWSAAGSLPVGARQIGRLPLLAPLPARGGKCRNAPVNASLRRSGIVRLTFYDGASLERTISVAADVRGRPSILMVMASVPAGEKRREGESLTVWFTPEGRVRRGDRRYYTMGVPATMAEDRQGGLLPSDASIGLELAKAVLALCA